MTENVSVVIMAGGGGTRLWPLSRQNRPKQFLDLGSGKTLLEHTYDRSRTVADPATIFVATRKEYQSEIQRLLPDVPPANIFFEPESRDNAPAFAAAATHLKLRGRAENPTIFMWSDHVFTKEQAFLDDLKKIPQLISAHPNSVVIVGHQPTHPETSLGYLEVGQPVPGHNDVFQVKSFKEKPDKATAESYLTAGNFYWNMAYISLRPTYLLQELAKHEPELMKGIQVFEAALAGNDQSAADKAYAKLPKLAIDYALLEKTSSIIAITGDYGWSDVGNWAAVKEVFGVTGDQLSAGHHIHVDSEDNYIYNATEKAVCLIGVKNTIVVVTEDAILVTSEDKAHEVKKVVAGLEQDQKGQYL